MSHNTATPENVIRKILDDEISSRRFELFCCELMSDVSGGIILPTSQSYDLGRDGRSVPSRDQQVSFLATTLRDDLDEKAYDDVTRLLKFVPAPASITVISTVHLTEYGIQQLTEGLKTKFAVPITVYGSDQLVALVSAHPQGFQRRYAAELLAYRDFLSRTDFFDEIQQTTGLKVALVTQLEDDASSLRESLLAKLILIALPASGTLVTRKTLAKEVSDLLRLPALIDTTYFHAPLARLVSSEDVFYGDSDDFVGITKNGLKALESFETEKARAITVGSGLIKAELDELLGSQLDSKEFAILWECLEDELSNVFFQNGLQVMQAISSLQAGDHLAGPATPIATLLQQLKTAVSNTGVGGARRDEVAQAVVDIFSERESAAFNWLADVAVKYVGLCSLGLEAAAQQEIAGRLSEIDLIIDTDIVLSLLSVGERSHVTIEEILKKWVALGGHVVVVPTVMEEAAYHAWICEFEYREVWGMLQRIRPSEVHRYAKNAFVRAFEATARPNLHPTRWRKFISEFRGTSEFDAQKIREILDDHRFLAIEDDEVDREFSKRVCNQIYRLRGYGDRDFVPKPIGEKVYRDGVLIRIVITPRAPRGTRSGTRT